MAFLILFEHLAIALYGSDLRTVNAGFSQVDLRFGGLVIGIPQLIGLVCSIVLIWGLSLLLNRTQLGRALRTIAEDSDTALLLGVNINRVVPIVFVVAGAFAAFAGIIFALNYRQVHPFMGEVVGLKGISAMIIGGMGNIWGSIVGGLVIGLVEVLAIGYFGADFVDIAVFGLLLLILFFRPTGLFAGMTAGRAAYERLSRGHSGPARGQYRLCLWRVPAARGRAVEYRACGLRRHRRLFVGLCQQRLWPQSAGRDSDRRRGRCDASR